MENYRLTQTGEEVQGILDNAATEQELTAEVERAQGAEQALGGAIDDEELRAKAAEETLGGAIGDEELRAKAAEEQNANGIAAINAKIPAGASSENQLADKDFVNSSIETATATFRGSYNLVSDLHLAVDATHAQIATLLGTVIAEADANDYSYVLVPTSAQTPTEIASIEKYTYGANGWAFAYALNNSGFTSAQWAAINSGITSGLVAKLMALPTNADLLDLLAGKQDVLTFDNVPVEGSTNPVKSGGVHSAIDDEKTARVNAMNALSGRVDTIEGEIPAQASSENQLADKAYVNSSISSATATFRGAFNLISDLGLTVSATHTQIGTALAGEILTADNNDYAFVQVPTSDETPAQILKVERYKFNGTAWVFEYELNNSGFTAAQWAALNSGITSGLVAKLVALPTNDELVLALAGKQDVLTFDNVPTENSNNPVKSGGVYAADKALSDAIEAILLLIPSAATSLNKLVDTDLMNSSISTATATFRGTFNLVSDLSLDLTATHAQIATALAGEIATADNNDYAFVLVPTSVGTPTEIASTDRYKFNGSSWAYEYTLNTSGFTSAQWAAINSGITAALVASLADIPDLIPSEATSANQLADKAYVLASILAATPAFKGQFTTLAELQAVASPKAGDLGIVRTKDSDGMDVFTVYQYLNNAWNAFYSLSYHPQTKPATTGTTGDYPYNGMGRVELAKNMVNTGTELAPVMVNQLTQAMLAATNTVYVIKYDYVLGEDITVPANCVLEFEGGSINGNYALIGNNTDINGASNSALNTSFSGTFICKEVYVDWFISNSIVDQTAISRALAVSNVILFSNKDYTMSNISIGNNATLYGNEANVTFSGTTDKLITVGNNCVVKGFTFNANTTCCVMIYGTNKSGIKILECNFIGTNYAPSSQGGAFIEIADSSNILIDKCTFKDGWNDHNYDASNYGGPNMIECIAISNHGHNNVTISNCTSDNTWTFCYVGNTNNLRVENNYITNTADTGIFDRCTSGWTKNKYIVGNTLKNIGKCPIKTLDTNNMISETGGENSIVANNYIENYGMTISHPALLCASAFDYGNTNRYIFSETQRNKNVTILNNTIISHDADGSSHGFILGNCIDNIKIIGNTFIADNSEEVDVGVIPQYSNGIINNNTFEFKGKLIGYDLYGRVEFSNNVIKGAGINIGAKDGYSSINKTIISNNIIDTLYSSPVYGWGISISPYSKSIITNNILQCNAANSATTQTSGNNPIGGTSGDCFIDGNIVIYSDTCQVNRIIAGDMQTPTYYQMLAGSTLLNNTTGLITYSGKKINDGASRAYAAMKTIAVISSGSSTNRPTGMPNGFEYYDTTLGKPIWYNGSVWVDATGATV